MYFKTDYYQRKINILVDTATTVFKPAQLARITSKQILNTVTYSNLGCHIVNAAYCLLMQTRTKKV